MTVIHVHIFRLHNHESIEIIESKNSENERCSEHRTAASNYLKAFAVVSAFVYLFYDLIKRAMYIEQQKSCLLRRFANHVATAILLTFYWSVPKENIKTPTNVLPNMILYHDVAIG